MDHVFNIIVADDHEIIRDGIVRILSRTNDYKVVGYARDGMEAVKLCEQLNPHIVIMDIGMPILNGIEATEQILSHNPSIKIIVLSAYEDESTITRALKTNISGFILKSGASEELIRALNACVKGHSYLSPKVSAHMMKALKSQSTSNNTNKKQIKSKIDTLTQLTRKEKHILQLIAEGMSSKEIANLLDISFHTVKTHRNHIMEKLELHNVSELTRYALVNNLAFKK